MWNGGYVAGRNAIIGENILRLTGRQASRIACAGWCPAQGIPLFGFRFFMPVDRVLVRFLVLPGRHRVVKICRVIVDAADQVRIGEVTFRTNDRPPVVFADLDRSLGVLGFERDGRNDKCQVRARTRNCAYIEKLVRAAGYCLGSALCWLRWSCQWSQILPGSSCSRWEPATG